MSGLTLEFIPEDLYYLAKTNSPKSELWINPRTGKKMKWTPQMEKWFNAYQEQILYFNQICR